MTRPRFEGKWEVGSGGCARLCPSMGTRVCVPARACKAGMPAPTASGVVGALGWWLPLVLGGLLLAVAGILLAAPAIQRSLLFQRTTLPSGTAALRDSAAAAVRLKTVAAAHHDVWIPVTAAHDAWGARHAAGPRRWAGTGPGPGSGPGPATGSGIPPAPVMTAAAAAAAKEVGRCHGWHVVPVAPAPGTPLVIYFHGNATNLRRYDRHIAAYVSAGYEVLAPDYRGYGHSSSLAPTPASLTADAAATWEHVAATLLPPPEDVACPRPVIIVGFSLGGAAALAAATAAAGTAAGAAVAALVLEAAFDDVGQAATHLSRAWLAPLAARGVVEAWLPNVTTLGALPPMPVLTLHAPEDNVTPPAASLRLAAAATGPATFMLSRRSGHGGPHTDERVWTWLAVVQRAWAADRRWRRRQPQAHAPTTAATATTPRAGAAAHIRGRG